MSPSRERGGPPFTRFVQQSLADDILCRKELQTGALVKCDPRLIRCVWYSIAVSNDMSKNSTLATFAAWLLEAARLEV